MTADLADLTPEEIAELRSYNEGHGPHWRAAIFSGDLARLLAEVERRRAAERVTCSHGVPLCLACAEDAERRALASSRSPWAERIATWVRTRFGESVLRDRRERTMRVVEEAIELAQAEGLSPDDVGRISARVFSRPAGEPSQEASGVGVTLIAWTVAAGVDLADLVEGEVARIEALPADHFRRKQAEKAAAGTALPPAPSKPGEPSAPPCGGSRCHQAADGAWIHSSKSYGTCSVRASKPGEEFCGQGGHGEPDGQPAPSEETPTAEEPAAVPYTGSLARSIVGKCACGGDLVRFTGARTPQAQCLKCKAWSWPGETPVVALIVSPWLAQATAAARTEIAAWPEAMRGPKSKTPASGIDEARCQHEHRILRSHAGVGFESCLDCDAEWVNDGKGWRGGRALGAKGK